MLTASAAACRRSMRKQSAHSTSAVVSGKSFTGNRALPRSAALHFATVSSIGVPAIHARPCRRILHNHRSRGKHLRRVRRDCSRNNRRPNVHVLLFYRRQAQAIRVSVSAAEVIPDPPDSAAPARPLAAIRYPRSHQQIHHGFQPRRIPAPDFARSPARLRARPRHLRHPAVWNPARESRSSQNAGSLPFTSEFASFWPELSRRSPTPPTAPHNAPPPVPDILRPRPAGTSPNRARFSTCIRSIPRRPPAAPSSRQRLIPSDRRN